jgi:hypothetical protein
MIGDDENVKVTQELMRHANCETTLDIYPKGVPLSKRPAHERIVEGLLPGEASTNRIAEPCGPTS